MHQFLIISNPKAHVVDGGSNVVFDYISYSAYRNPNIKQKEILQSICDGYRFVEVESIHDISKETDKGDRVYQVIGVIEHTKTLELYMIS